MSTEVIFIIALVIMSVVIHELSHGYMAYFLGDHTAKYAGRLTINPLKHLDPIGSILVPLMSYFLGGFIIGWAKPVPYNPYNLHVKRWGDALVAVAGPLSNIFIALVFGLTLRFGVDFLNPSFIELASYLVLINISLAVFNLLPVPPLDGSKILYSLISYEYRYIRDFLDKYSLLILIFVIFFLWQAVAPVVFFLFKLFVGAPFM